MLVLAFCGTAQAQVTGTVSDAKDQSTLPGVTIFNKNSKTGSSTDEQGRFTLDVDNYPVTLSFSFIGYRTQELVVNEPSNLSIALKEDNINLNEVVVTALGEQRDKSKLGYSIQELESREISSVKSANFLDNLSGKLAGVTVSQGATGVGSSSKITIRGESSFTNNNPLFIVDGLPINNNSIINVTNDAAAGFQEVDFGNGGMEVNPDDIASVSVLKGPGAAALYGTRAANGVIVIETKNGSGKKGLGVSYNNSTYFERPFQLPQFQNKYGQGNSGNFEYVDGLGGGINDAISYSYGPRLDQGTLIPQYDSPVVLADGTVVRGGDTRVHNGAPITATEFKSHPDNLKNFYETGVTTINNIAINSSNNLGNFRLSFTDLYSKSIIPGVDLKRKTIGTRNTFYLNEKLQFGSSINYVNSKSDNRPSSGYGSENINYSLVAWGPRSLDIAPMKDYWQPGFEDLQQYSFNYTYFDNPYFTLYENRNAFNRDRIFGNIFAKYQINDQLSVRIRSGMDYSTELRTFRRAFSTNRFKNGAYAEHSVQYREVNTDLGINYQKIFGDITLDAYAGANSMNQQAMQNQSQALALAKPAVYNFTNAAVPLEIFQYQAEKQINSLYALAKLGYKDYLFVDITGRNDWSSALATVDNVENVSFFYPSISSSFILSRVVELPEIVSFAKLRASWAQVGNDTDPYQTQNVFVAQTPVNGAPTFSEQGLISNRNLLPERTTSIEIGGDFRFFKDRLLVDVALYQNQTENQIIALPVPISSGYDQQVVNGGLIQTEGVEVLVGYTPVRKKNFIWNTQVNFTSYRSIVKELPDGVDRITLAYSRVYDNVNQSVFFIAEEGGRIGDMHGTGYMKTEDGQFILDENGNFIADQTLKKIGNYNPDFIIGINNQFTYKNFTASLLLDWRQGGEIVSRTQALAGVAGQLIETENRPEGGIVADGVVQNQQGGFSPNTTAISAESYYRQYYDRNHEENNTLDASYLKIRELSIGYTFKPGALGNGFFRNIENLNISIIGRNLYAFSKIKHFDPEQLAVQGNNFISGVEDMSYASTRSIGFKVGFNF